MKQPDSTLPEINHLLTTLIHSTHKVQIFKSKWSLISSKLNTLQSKLTLLPSIQQNPLSSTLLISLSTTLSSALTLYTLCLSATPTAGKLKTQNDVASLSSTLDSHIHDIDVLSNMNDFQETERESVVNNNINVFSCKSEAKNLITMLQIGSTESKSKVLDTLLGLLQENDKNVIVVVKEGAVPVLVRLLDTCCCYEIKEKSVNVIARISMEESSKSVLLGEGLVLVNNLLRVIESGSVFVKEKACVVLGVMSGSKENARAVASRGGVSSLLEICVQGTPSSQGMAAGVLRKLAAFDEIKESFVEERAMFVLLGLCNSGTALAQENSIGCLCNLVSGDDDLKLLFAREGGIECLKNLWDSDVTNEGVKVVVEMVRTLALCPNIAEFLVGNGFLNRVVVALGSAVIEVRIGAALAVYDLGYSTKTRKELGEMGCVSFLVKMLDGKTVEEKEAAVKALSMIINYEGNRKIFRKEEKGIVSAVHLLDTLPQESDKKYLVLLLSSLAQSKKCRRQIVDAGACVYLQKLVEAEVDGAKKLFDDLGHGKLWRVFNRP